MRTLAVALLGVMAASAAAQQQKPPPTAVRGVPAPGALRARPVRDTSLVRTLNGIEVLADTTLGNPLLGVRVLGTWGEWAGLDSDAILTHVYVTVNEDGDQLRAFALGQLLDPTVERMTDEGGAAVIYLTYGLPRERRRVRIEASLGGLRFGSAPARSLSGVPMDSATTQRLCADADSVLAGRKACVLRDERARIRIY